MLVYVFPRHRNMETFLLHQEHQRDDKQKLPVELLQNSLVQPVKLIPGLSSQQRVVLKEGLGFRKSSIFHLDDFAAPFQRFIVGSHGGGRWTGELKDGGYEAGGA